MSQKIFHIKKKKRGRFLASILLLALTISSLPGCSKSGGADSILPR